MNKTSVISRIAAITGLALGGFALSVFATSTWTAPAGSAQGNNVDAPINVGATSQKKVGALGIGNGTMPGGTTIFDVFGSAVINALSTASINVTGTPGSLTVSGATILSGPVKITSGASSNVGKYLQMADASGNITWGTPSGSGGSTPPPSSGGTLILGTQKCFGGGCGLGDLPYRACPKPTAADPTIWVLVGWTIHSGGAPSAGICAPLSIESQ